MSMYRRFRFVPLAFVSVAVTTSVALADISQFAITDAELTSPGVVTVTGTILCPAGESWFLSTEVSQNAKDLALGSGFASGACTGSLLTWTAEVTSFTGIPFKHGKAFVRADANACSFFFCEFARTTSNESL